MAAVCVGQPRRHRRTPWVVGAGGVVFVVAAFLVNHATQTRQARDAAEPSAWQARQELESVIVQTADAIDLHGEPHVGIDSAQACERRDGRIGVFYTLASIKSDDELPETDAALRTISSLWTDLGYTGSEGVAAGALALSAKTPTGAVLTTYAGPGGITITGETHCALTDGRPGSSTEGH